MGKSGRYRRYIEGGATGVSQVAGLKTSSGPREKSSLCLCVYVHARTHAQDSPEVIEPCTQRGHYLMGICILPDARCYKYLASRLVPRLSSALVGARQARLGPIFESPPLTIVLVFPRAPSRPRCAQTTNYALHLHI